MARAEEWFGLAGVAWLFGLMLVGAGLRRSTSVARAGSNPLLAAVLTAPPWSPRRSGLSMRPQVLSFLLVVDHRSVPGCAPVTTTGSAGGWSR